MEIIVKALKNCGYSIANIFLALLTRMLYCRNKLFFSLIHLNDTKKPWFSYFSSYLNVQCSLPTGTKTLFYQTKKSFFIFCFKLKIVYTVNTLYLFVIKRNKWNQLMLGKFYVIMLILPPHYALYKLNSEKS